MLNFQVLRQVKQQLLMRKFQHTQIIVAQIQNSINFIQHINIDFCLSESYLPQLGIEMRMDSSSQPLFSNNFGPFYFRKQVLFLKGRNYFNKNPGEATMNQLTKLGVIEEMIDQLQVLAYSSSFLACRNAFLEDGDKLIKGVQGNQTYEGLLDMFGSHSVDVPEIFFDLLKGVFLVHADCLERINNYEKSHLNIKQLTNVAVPNNFYKCCLDLSNCLSYFVLSVQADFLKNVC